MEIHASAAFVHGMLVFGHALGIVYNVRRRNRWDAVAHMLGLAYSLRSARIHMKEITK